VSFTVHETNPADLAETTFFRIQQERMAGLPMLNPVLSVEAVDFQRWRGHWLGVLITPWSMSMLLVPGKADDWETVGIRDNKRRYIKFPAGDFAFLGGDEEGLGEFQSCPLFSPMDRFSSQAEATQTARASMIAIMQQAVATIDPFTAKANAEAAATESGKSSEQAAVAGVQTSAPVPDAPDAPVSPSRRRFFGLARKAGTPGA
jgi:[NiFe] hydrogenase assembly HybE family chaperone